MALEGLFAEAVNMDWQRTASDARRACAADLYSKDFRCEGVCAMQVSITYCVQ